MHQISHTPTQITENDLDPRGIQQVNPDVRFRLKDEENRDVLEKLDISWYVTTREDVGGFKVSVYNTTSGKEVSSKSLGYTARRQRFPEVPRGRLESSCTGWNRMDYFIIIRLRETFPCLFTFILYRLEYLLTGQKIYLQVRVFTQRIEYVLTSLNVYLQNRRFTFRSKYLLIDQIMRNVSMSFYLYIG